MNTRVCTATIIAEMRARTRTRRPLIAANGVPMTQSYPRRPCTPTIVSFHMQPQDYISGWQQEVLHAALHTCPNTAQDNPSCAFHQFESVVPASPFVGGAGAPFLFCGGAGCGGAGCGAAA
jgi:hypothetical protein